MSIKKVQFVVHLLLCLLLVGLVQAQPRGTIVGKVTDANSGDFLPGANILLQGTTHGAASDRQGNFRVVNVPPGTYTLTVRYIGYDAFSTQVTVDANAETQVQVELQPSYLVAEEVIVTGVREGQIKALNQQRIAANIKNVVAREEMERFPDLNTAEVLQRVPGVNISRDLGEGKFVFLRGTEPRLTTVTVNGEQIATPEDEERFVALDVISAHQLASIEVTKTITPDMDGDAIAGVVNLVTRSAFDYPGRYYRFGVGGGYNNLSSKPNYRGSLTLNDTFGNGRFGYSISANWQQANRATHNNEMKWDFEEDVNGNVLPFALRDLELRDYFNQRNRYGGSAQLEFRPSGQHRFYVGGMFNRRDDYQRRNQFRVRVNKGDYITATEIEKTRVVRALQERTETQTIISLNGGGDHTFGNLRMTYYGAYSFGEQVKEAPKGQIIPEFQMNAKANITLDLSDMDAPKFNVTNLDPSYLNDPANFEIDQIDWRAENTTNKDLVGAVNFDYGYRLGNSAGTLKFGGKIRSRSKDRNDERMRYKWKGDETIVLAPFAGEIVENFQGGDYVFGPRTDPDKIRDFFDANRDRAGRLEGSLRVDETFGEKYDASEDIAAYYLMATHQFGKLMVVAGLRHEFTSTKYTGTFLAFNEDGDFVEATPQSDSRSYNNLFPNLQFRYSVTPNTNVRLAYTTGISRGNYFDLVPYFFLVPEDRIITRGNPNLDPTTSNNFDFLVEHYFQGIGILSGGVFLKDLDKIIYKRTFLQSGGNFDGFQITEPVNGGSATLWGVEINWQQQFTFLPGWLSGFGIYANYTYTQSDADLLFRERSLLPGQASNAGNLALTYQKYGLTARLALNYNGKFIDEIGKTEDFDEWRDDHVQLDFSGSYRVARNLDFFLEVINITNEPRRDYMGIPSRTIQRDFYSFWMNAGFRWRM